MIEIWIGAPTYLPTYLPNLSSSVEEVVVSVCLSTNIGWVSDMPPDHHVRLQHAPPPLPLLRPFAFFRRCLLPTYLPTYLPTSPPPPFLAVNSGPHGVFFFLLARLRFEVRKRRKEKKKGKRGGAALLVGWGNRNLTD